MAFSHRNYISGSLYELTFRAKEGIPFPPLQLIELIIESALARTQRDFKVNICHYVWMGNHPHIILRMKDAKACMSFYKELKNKLTSSLKALLGIDYLNLWEKRPNVGLIPDIETAITRIVYLYCNPARANLVDSIELYPGCSTYQWFKGAKPLFTSQIRKEVPWIRAPMLEVLHSAVLSEKSDAGYAKKARESAKKKHPLIIEPNLWMKCFKGIKEEHITEINERILFELNGLESECRQLRAKEGKTVIGVTRLKATPILRPHTPKKSKEDQQVPILCTNKALRIACLIAHKEFTLLCKARFIEWNNGDFTNPWPPSGFRPPMMPLASALE